MGGKTTFDIDLKGNISTFAYRALQLAEPSAQRRVLSRDSVERVALLPHPPLPFACNPPTHHPRHRPPPTRPHPRRQPAVCRPRAREYFAAAHARGRAARRPVPPNHLQVLLRPLADNPRGASPHGPHAPGSGGGEHARVPSGFFPTLCSGRGWVCDSPCCVIRMPGG